MKVTIEFEIMDNVEASEIETFLEHELCKLSDNDNTVQFNICDIEVIDI